jgi:acetyl-CoA carboxylase biotin carboxylase subunit
MFSRVLIANRGEIAVRVIRACRERGIESVAVYSDADAQAMHVRQADRAVRIGPAPARESYLSIGAIIDAARASGADAIHPGYGFLSEQPALADACAGAGLVFIGPPSEALERMGSKVAARQLVSSHGVPVVPGETPVDQSDGAIRAAASRVGYPVLVKASAGGGGIGMREVRTEDGLAAAVQGARRDAESAFGDGTLYIERLVDRPRHVEIQVLGDVQGNIVHLFERECSLQRRHQKLIEESPSVAVSPALRARMGAAAVAAARAAGYRNAGTVEFLLEGAGDGATFYFLEMNARLQVEHPVTECVTGVDLVHAQLDVAAGEPLRWRQDELTQRGHAIECRVYAEDPSRQFLPQAGPLLLYREPRGPGIRVDAGVEEGDAITVHYDPLVAKLITRGERRLDAVARARMALRHFPILGIRTNTGYLAAVLEHAGFRDGAIDTGWLEREGTELLAAVNADAPAEAAAAAVAAAGQRQHAPGPATAPAFDPWDTLGPWRTGA